MVLKLLNTWRIVYICFSPIVSVFRPSNRFATNSWYFWERNFGLKRFPFSIHVVNFRFELNSSCLFEKASAFPQYSKIHRRKLENPFILKRKRKYFIVVPKSIYGRTSIYISFAELFSDIMWNWFKYRDVYYKIGNDIKFLAVKRGSGRPVDKIFTFIKFKIAPILFFILAIKNGINGLVNEFPLNQELQIALQIFVGVGSVVIAGIASQK